MAARTASLCLKVFFRAQTCDSQLCLYINSWSCNGVTLLPISLPICILPTSHPLLTPRLSSHSAGLLPHFSLCLALPSDSVLMSPMSALILSHSGSVMCSLILNGLAVRDAL